MIALIFINNILFVNDKKEPIQPVSGKLVPRYAGPSTFARIPELRDVDSCDVAIIGVPFDAGTSYRPGAVSYTHLTLPTICSV